VTDDLITTALLLSDEEASRARRLRESIRSLLGTAHDPPPTQDQRMYKRLRSAGWPLVTGGPHHEREEAANGHH
jgi:hypothetical protein